MDNVPAQSLYRLHYTKNLDLNMKVLKDQVHQVIMDTMLLHQEISLDHLKLKDQLHLLVYQSMLTSQVVMDTTLLHQAISLDHLKLSLFYLSRTNQILVMALTHTGNILK